MADRLLLAEQAQAAWSPDSGVLACSSLSGGVRLPTPSLGIEHLSLYFFFTHTAKPNTFVQNHLRRDVFFHVGLKRQYLFPWNSNIKFTKKQLLAYVCVIKNGRTYPDVFLNSLIKSRGTFCHEIWEYDHIHNNMFKIWCLHSFIIPPIFHIGWIIIAKIAILNISVDYYGLALDNWINTTILTWNCITHSIFMFTV